MRWKTVTENFSIKITLDIKVVHSCVDDTEAAILFIVPATASLFPGIKTNAGPGDTELNIQMYYHYIEMLWPLPQSQD